MDINKLTKGSWVLCLSSNDECDICTAIKDKSNGNTLVANDVDEDYAPLLLAVPEMYEEIEREYSALLHEIQNCTNIEKVKILKVVAERKSRILAKARGE